MALITDSNTGQSPQIACRGGCVVVQADWLELPSRLEAESIDLLYADPPFNTGGVRVGRGGRYVDRWPTVSAYISWLSERLIASVPPLKDSANILIHVDWRTSHRVRVLLDEVLGEQCFVNHLIWSYGLGGSSPRRFARKHDDILFYCKNPERAWFDPPQVPATSRRMRGQSKKATDVIDIPAINNMAQERTGYPTQKPLALLDMLIRACCPSGGTVLDPCCGSGTTLVAAVLAGRGAVGGDVSPAAVALSRRRLDEARVVVAGRRP